ncbi:phosphatidic acid phosphatase type 2/haloperoxidase [Schizophyllum amplum]|uniref:Phosphatidic acid phosphatase type 2/haloperoxidase n=1 Tax=Schizophyllum amplum TaxID=97359 RepID=A0A550C3G5_9AGAR|nr:phosphatidic acid phosphatase type 2/haloperoxidase [Auriculariopsis ampla]
MPSHITDKPDEKPIETVDPSWKRLGLRFLDRADAVSFLGSCAAILYTRSAGVAYVPACGLVCSITVKFLKRVIRQPRPPHPKLRKKTYGMPSTHSAVVSYFATYVLLASARLRIHPSLPPAPAVTRLLPALVIVPWATLVACSRVWLGKHSWIQVIAGCSYGVLCAATAFSLWTRGGLSDYGQLIERIVNEILPF